MISDDCSIIKQMKCKTFFLFAYMILTVLFMGYGAVLNAEIPRTAKQITVSPSERYTSLQQALDAAENGDTIEVLPGVYHGNFIVKKSVTLLGKNFPVLDGNGNGTVVTLAAPGVVLDGFEIRNSGNEPDNNSDSGIIVSAPDCVVKNNRLKEVLFGIFLQKSDRTLVSHNFVTGKKRYEVGRKGDGIKIWYSSGVHVEKNKVTEARDVVVWYSPGVVMRKNIIEKGRYGIHLMFCDGMRIEENTLSQNYVGIFVMYSKDISIKGNLIQKQHGTSGYALGFKESDNLNIAGNVLLDNRAGAFMDTTPYTPGSFSRFRKNIFAFNEMGILFLASTHGNTFRGNTFWENTEQVSIQGGGEAPRNDWKGNYWSDYVGFDLNHDGKGDLPYTSEKFFENLTDRNPMLSVLNNSPVAQAVELTTATFPVVKPQPKLTDASPLTTPLPIPTFVYDYDAERNTSGNKNKLKRASLFLMGLTGLGIFLGFSQKTNGKAQTEKTITPFADGNISISGKEQQEYSARVRNVTKNYGSVKALDNVSFEARQGEAIALWGSNGAGKTTLLKVLLGIVPFEGHVDIKGWDVKRHEKNARKNIGYVPQEFAFHEWSVRETMEFYCRIKKVALSEIKPALETAGLTDYMRVSVLALSGGLKQRVALALALLGNPPILLLDEPTANLDSKMRQDYLTLLKNLKKFHNKTLIFASHRLEEVHGLADSVLVLEQGKIKNIVTPDELWKPFSSTVSITFYVHDEEREKTLNILKNNGFNANLNGKGTVTVDIATAEKIRPVQFLIQQGIRIIDMEISNG